MELYTIYVLDFLTRAAQCAIQRLSKKMHGPREAINKWRAVHSVKSLKKAWKLEKYVSINARM